MRLSKDQVKHVAKLAKKEPHLKLRGKTAVFIDAANIELSAKDLGFRVDYKKLFNWLSKASKLKYIGFYTVSQRIDRKCRFLS